MKLLKIARRLCICIVTLSLVVVVVSVAAIEQDESLELWKAVVAFGALTMFMISLVSVHLIDNEIEWRSRKKY